jgi:hypothetical protein
MAIKRYIFIYLIVQQSVLLACIWTSLPVKAATATFSQNILPLDCLFETVNDGTNTIHYLTPAQCGQIINIPNIPSSSTFVSPIAQYQGGQYVGNVFYVGPASNKPLTKDASVRQLPWQNIATGNNNFSKSASQTADKIGQNTGTIAVASTLAALLILAIFLFG